MKELWDTATKLEKMDRFTESTTKKGKIKSRRVGAGALNSILKSNILDILYKVESEIKYLFIKFDGNNLNLLIEETNNLKLINKNLLNKDFKSLVIKFKFCFKITQLIKEFTVETKDMKNNWQDLNNLINTLVNDSTLEELFITLRINNYFFLERGIIDYLYNL